MNVYQQSSYKSKGRIVGQIYWNVPFPIDWTTDPLKSLKQIYLYIECTFMTIILIHILTKIIFISKI